MDAPVAISTPLPLLRSPFFPKTLSSRRSPFARLRSSLTPPLLQSNPSAWLWNPAPLTADRRYAVAVVLLGWVGSKTKHLKRLAGWYNSMGFDVVVLCVEVRELLWFDLGQRLLQRVGAMAEELGDWVSEDGCDRSLIFHSFSNTGLIAYGEILNRFQGRCDVIEKVRGCIVDSGCDDSFNAKVAAAALYACWFNKRNVGEQNGLETDRNKKSVFEIVLLFVLEKFSSFILSLPDVDRRLTRILSILTEKQPACPQLYLYSTADKVIPFRKVESSMGEQRRLGKKVQSFNFGSSGHVQHHMKYPDMYATVVNRFVEECRDQVDLGFKFVEECRDQASLETQLS